MFSFIAPLTGKQTSGQPQITDPPSANDSSDNITRQSSCSSFQILSRSSSSSSVAGVSSHGSEGSQLVPQGTSGVLGAGLLAASFGGGVPISNAAERLKNELIPASMLVSEDQSYVCCLGVSQCGRRACWFWWTFVFKPQLLKKKPIPHLNKSRHLT